ncbi:MAG: S8 family serine peptidase, partial [Clostridia bacterium]
MKKSKNLIIVLAIMMLAIFVIVGSACTKNKDNSKVINDKNLNFSVIDELIKKDVNKNELKNQEVGNLGYKADDKVWVAVEIEGENLAELFLSSHRYGSVSELAMSIEGSEKLNSMRDSQMAVVQAAQEAGIKMTVKHSYTTVVNGFSAQIKFGDLNKLRSIANVKSVVVAQKYEMSNATTTYTNEKMSSYFGKNGMLSNTTGYNGEGMFVAVIDSGMDYMHSAFQTAPQTPAVSQEYIEKVMGALYVNNNFGMSFSVEELYKSIKVPFGFDYADGDTDCIAGISTYFRDFGMEHGTHVAGIVAGDDAVIKGAAA